MESSLPPAEFGRLLAELPHPLVKVNYDSGNSSSLGYKPSEEFAAYGCRVGSVHIKDRISMVGTVPLGQGDADLEAVFAGLRRINYAGDIVLQVARGVAGDEVEWARCNRAFVERYHHTRWIWGWRAKSFLWRVPPGELGWESPTPCLTRARGVVTNGAARFSAAAAAELGEGRRYLLIAIRWRSASLGLPEICVGSAIQEAQSAVANDGARWMYWYATSEAAPPGNGCRLTAADWAPVSSNEFLATVGLVEAFLPAMLESKQWRTSCSDQFYRRVETLGAPIALRRGQGRAQKLQPGPCAASRPAREFE